MRAARFTAQPACSLLKRGSRRGSASRLAGVGPGPRPGGATVPELICVPRPSLRATLYTGATPALGAQLSGQDLGPVAARE